MKRAVRVMGVIAALALCLLVGMQAAIRLAPSDPAIWHVDPALVAVPETPNHWLLRADGNAPPLLLPLPPDQAAARLEAIALATPRTRRLAGQGVHVTYITRSPFWGFPDYTSVRITATPTGSAVVMFARARFGTSDMGVNRRRVEDWIAQLRS